MQRSARLQIMVRGTAADRWEEIGGGERGKGREGVVAREDTKLKKEGRSDGSCKAMAKLRLRVSGRDPVIHQVDMTASAFAGADVSGLLYQVCIEVA